LLISAPTAIKQQEIKIEVRDTDKPLPHLPEQSSTLTLSHIPADSTCPSFSVTGTLIGGRLYLLAVEGVAFWQPVRLEGHLVMYRTSAATPTNCLDQLSHCINGTAILSYVSTLKGIKNGNKNETPGDIWSAIQLSASLPASSFKSLLGNGAIIKQMSFT